MPNKTKRNKTTTYLPMTKEHIRFMLVFQAWFDIAKIALSADSIVSSSLKRMRNFFNEYADLQPVTDTKTDLMPISGASSSSGLSFFSASSSSDLFSSGASSSSGPSVPLSLGAVSSCVSKPIPHLPRQVIDFLTALSPYLDVLVRDQLTGDVSSAPMIAIFKTFYEHFNLVLGRLASAEDLLSASTITDMTRFMDETINSICDTFLPGPQDDSPVTPYLLSAQVKMMGILAEMQVGIKRLNENVTDLFIANKNNFEKNKYAICESIKNRAYKNTYWDRYILAFILHSFEALNIEYDHSGFITRQELSPSLLKSNIFLAYMLRWNTTITQLTLSYYGINAEVTKYLADMLQVNTTLVSLSLRENRIGVEGAKYLANALKDNTTLTSLDLFLCDIGDEGAKYIADMLRVNTTLTSLNLSSCNISDVGLAYLTEALQHNTTLISLDVRGIDINVARGKAIADMLERNGALTSLNGGVEQCDADTLRRIEQYLVRNKHNQEQKKGSLVSTLFTRTEVSGTTVSSSASPVPEVPSLSS